ncbi:MAG TPA: hypothetical protein VN824_22190 [Puia sp.]|nr:hypothetical protein [Puia sp.]
MKLRSYIGRQLLLGIIALQILNLSVGSPTSLDVSTYDYAYTYNKTYDPTESAVEFIVEMSYGQQPGFSYNLHEDAGKSPTKSFHWKTDLQKTVVEPAFFPTVRRPHLVLPDPRIISHPQDTFSPPPEEAIA